jgi:ABC-type bacteriocin/lantibiotic exporter with double-glycine peptidase domain
MSWLDVPRLQQAQPGWCRPACVAMVAACWRPPLPKADAARWLGTGAIGTVAGRVTRLEGRGFQVTYRVGSAGGLTTWLAQSVPCILFWRTGERPYWPLGTPHAVVLAGTDADQAYLFDPAWDTAPVMVPMGDLLLAWSDTE